MSRHRNFRNIDVDEEREEYDDYGQSVEDNYSYSPSSSEFMYRRSSTKMHDFIEDESIMPSNDSNRTPIVSDTHPKPTNNAITAKVTNGRPASPQVVKSGSKMTAGFSVAAQGQVTSGQQPTNLPVERLKLSDVGSSPSPSRSGSPLRSVPSATRLSQMTSSSQPATPRIKNRPAHVKPLLNLVVVGHVDAGKSTLMGHLLYLLGGVSQKTMHKHKQDSQKLGKGSFAFAWVLDDGSEERTRGVTMDIARARFSTDKFDVVLLDAPGHKDFIPNMISGAAQADAAILVVNATTGEFETGFDLGGQTREHTMLIRSLGVSQLVVAVNKLDTVDWSRDRFEDIVGKIRTFLKQTGFTGATFVPCCGLTGDNLTKTPENGHSLRRWYKGPTLLEAIDNLKPPDQNVDSPLRFTISDIYKGMTSSSLVSGKMESGAVQVNDKIIIMPSGESGQVKSIQTDETLDANVAYAGDQCSLSLLNVDLSNVTVGDVICHPESPIAAVVKFEARMVFFNVPRPITKGYPVVIHCNSNQRSGTISKLISQINGKTGEVVKLKPRCLTKNSSGVVEISTEKPICLELYSQNKEMGRVTLRSEGQTLAAGVVTKLITGSEE